MERAALASDISSPKALRSNMQGELDDINETGRGKSAALKIQSEPAAVLDATLEKYDFSPPKPSSALGAIALKANLENVPPEKDNRAETAKAFVRRHGEQLSLFARDSSLRFVPSISAETFAFSPETFEVQVPTSWFDSEKYNENELQFANYHELAHFIDMRKNPTAFLENFKRMEKDANSLAANYRRSHNSTHSNRDVANFYYKELHTLYNALDDIYVNNLVFGRNHFFDYGDGKASVGTLYEKLGFGSQDLTKEPLHRQMLFSLLRDEMISDTHGKSTVDERVKAVLSKKKLGKTITELIDTELKPRSGILVDPEHRYKTIRSLIQPEYLKLLEISLDEADSKQKNQSKSNGSEQNNTNQQERTTGADGPEQENDSAEQNSANSFDPFDDNNGQKIRREMFSEQPSEDTIKDILNSFQEVDNVSKMSPEERTRYQAEKQREMFDKKHNITPEERKLSDETKAKIAPLRKAMRQFWRSLIGKSIEYRQTKISHQKKGRLNINSYVSRYPDVVESEKHGDLRELEIYDRQGLERQIIDQPERIDITLLVDCSGSMSHGGKIDAAREAAALLMYSVKDFNDELAMSRRQTHSKLRANTEVITFGSMYKKVKTFDDKISHSKNDAEIIKSISSIDSSLGSTDDASPLAKILAGISPEEKSKIKSKKLKKIIFEITDGRPDSPEKTKERLSQLSADGVLVVGFQIGDVEKESQAIFQQIWNEDENNPNKKGIFIGTDISKLPQRLMAALSESLNNIII